MIVSRKWEQAFRVYAGIYCKSNPDRSTEIIQYIDNINRAAKSFPWENVAAYDFTFRKLMEKYPKRNWGKHYTQLYLTTLCAPNNKTSYINGHFSSQNQSSQKPDWKKGLCWRFNKGECKFGKRCRFQHRCNHCSSPEHPATKCPKLKNKKKKKGGNQQH